jgi:hypothetical protein
MDGERTPAEIAAEVEDLTRAILKDAACGHLGGDLRATADEILLADGLAVGEGSADQLGETAEWDGMPIDGEEAEPQEEVPLVDELRSYEEADEAPEPDSEPDPVSEPDETPEPVAEPDEEPQPVAELDEKPVSGPGRQPELWLDGVEDGEEEVSVRRTRTTVRRAENLIHRFIEANEAPAEEPTELLEEQPEARVHEREREQPARGRQIAMLEPAADESSVEGMLQQREADREEISDRIAYLFPRPETCEWDLRELGYDRRRGRATAS